MSEKTYPLELYDVGPHPDAVRIENTVNSAGRPSGVHCGAWEWRDSVWKPTTCRPYANADYLVETQEVQLLTELRGQPLFPDNWRLEQANGRQWIVRARAIRIPEDRPYSHTDQGHMEAVLAGVHAMNAHRWVLHDDLDLALQKGGHYLPFLYDCSTAMKRSGPVRDDDSDREYAVRWIKHADPEYASFLENAGRLHGQMLATLLAGGHTTTSALNLLDHYREHPYVYASMYRPIDGMWASFPCSVRYLPASANRSTPYTWVLAAEPLPAEKIESYELWDGWIPWPEHDA